MDILSGIAAIFLVIVILIMKESESKAIGYIGLGILVVAKLSAGAEGINTGTAILFIIGIISVGVVIQYYKVKKHRAVYEAIDKELTDLKAREDLEKFQTNQQLLIKYNDEKNRSIALVEEEFNNKIKHIKSLFDQNKISFENYEKSIKGIEKKYLETRNSLYSSNSRL